MSKPVRGQACRLFSRFGDKDIIVCFVEKYKKNMSIISWPAMGGTAPVENKEFVLVDEDELTDYEKNELKTAREGMERYCPARK